VLETLTETLSTAVVCLLRAMPLEFGLPFVNDGSWALWCFYLRHLHSFRALPEPLRYPPALYALLRRAKPFEIAPGPASDAAARRYNADLAATKARVRDACAGALPKAPFRNTMGALFAVRAAMLWAAWWRGDLALAVALSALQFAVAPMSLFVAATQFVALCTPLMLGTVAAAAAPQAAAAAARAAAAAVLPPSLQPAAASLLQLRVDGAFIAVFFALDQLQCAACYFNWFEGDEGGGGGRRSLSGKGPTRPVTSARKLAAHVLFGFANSKTYTLVLLLLMRAARCDIDLLAWALEARLGLGARLCEASMRWAGVHWQPLFYHQHRMAHLPRVYEHAHKMHHYLHDATAFDAHNYGSGLPEEWCLLMFELAAALGPLRLTPPTLCSGVLLTSWTNKTGHTRGDSEAHGVNHHCDHHTYHNKNFGIFSCVLDLYFGTNAPHSDSCEFAGYMVTKKQQEEPAGPAATDGSGSDGTAADGKAGDGSADGEGAGAGVVLVFTPLPHCKEGLRVLDTFYPDFSAMAARILRRRDTKKVD
jgi:sterol desaturase/sphingolipid hydroxylase (fatty acid hydroxylase superfamily)